MMTVRLRIAAMLARWALTGRQAPPVATSRLALRCVWTDCDINGHMNNSRYLALMDLGRWHYMLATGLWRFTLDRKWAPVAVRVEIDYKKSLKPGDRFELETEACARTERSVTIRQRFWRDGVLAADAKVVVLFMHKGQVQALAPLLEAVPHARPVARPPEEPVPGSAEEPAPGSAEEPVSEPVGSSALDRQVDQREAAHVGE